MALKNNPTIYEVLFDLYEKFKKFFIKFYLLFVIIIVIICGYGIYTFNHSRKITNYNRQVLELINVNVNQLNKDYVDKMDYVELEKLYNSGEEADQINKTIIGLNLAQFYLKNNKVEEARNIYKEIYEKEKDDFFKYLAGLNLISISSNEEDFANDIRRLYNQLNVKDNVLLDLIHEQFALYLFEHGKKDEGKEVLNRIMNPSNEMKKRLESYSRIYNLKL